MSVLSKADNILRRLLGLSSSSYKKEAILALKDTPKWVNVKLLIKSFLRSTLSLLGQVTDSEILAFALTRFGVSLTLFAAFPCLLWRLIKNQLSLEKDRYKIHQAFIVAEGNFFNVADYGQLELRILAHLVHCKRMLGTFKAGRDFHSRTALHMYPHIREAVEKCQVLLEWHPRPGEDKPPVTLPAHCQLLDLTLHKLGFAPLPEG